MVADFRWEVRQVHMPRSDRAIEQVGALLDAVGDARGGFVGVGVELLMREGTDLVGDQLWRHEVREVIPAVLNLGKPLALAADLLRRVAGEGGTGRDG